MLEHLEDEDKFKFTRKRVEGLLQKETANSKSNLDSEEIAALELLSEDVYSLQDQDNRFDNIDLIDRAKQYSSERQEESLPEDLLFEERSEKQTDRSNNLDDLDELLEEESRQEKKTNLNSKQQSPPQPLSRENPDVIIDRKVPTGQNRRGQNILEKASQTLDSLGRKADTYTSDTDGMTFIASSLKMSAAGIAIANKLLEGREAKKLEATIARIAKAQKRTSNLTERLHSLEQNSDEDETEIEDELELDDRSELDVDEQLELDEDEELEDKIARELTGAVQSLNKRLRDVNPDIPAELIVIDSTADFYKQLEQINAALDRLEQKLDSLEERVERLEKQQTSDRDSLDSEQKQEKTPSQPEEEDLDTQLVKVLLDVCCCYEQINPDSREGINIGDRCQLYSHTEGDNTALIVEEKDDDDLREIFRATVDTAKGEFAIEIDELELEEKESMVEGFGQKVAEIKDYLEKQQQQKPERKKQGEIATI